MGISVNNINQSLSSYQRINASSQQQHREKEVSKEILHQGDYSEISSHGDTLSISEKGKELSLNNGKENEVKNENLTDDLSSYTEIELKQMYIDGTITKSEYNEELDSREE